MKVSLISYSQPVIKTDNNYCCEDLVVFCARVSNPSNQTNTLNSEKLIKYLMSHSHWSPFEMVNICLEIETTRDIARQILRHRSFSFQEFSQRYAKADLGFHVREARLQDVKNRQSSIELTQNDLILQEEFKQKQEEIIHLSQKTYEWAIEQGIAKEQARVVLPEGNTVSKLYMNGSLRSWIHYLQIRTGIETQKEHREVALACLEAIEPIFPLIRNILLKNI